MTDDDAVVREIDVTIERISRLLRGLDMEVQSGALGDLLAICSARHSFFATRPTA
jgi:hypothetical protein